jgi:ribosome-binding protein aMBF1 (putative translation factor)
MERAAARADGPPVPPGYGLGGATPGVPPAADTGSEKRSAMSSRGSSRAMDNRTGQRGAMPAPGKCLVRAVRQAAHLSQAALAKRLGRSQSAVAHLEAQGMRVQVGTLDRVARAAGCRIRVTIIPG